MSTMEDAVIGAVFVVCVVGFVIMEIIKRTIYANEKALKKCDNLQC